MQQYDKLFFAIWHCIVGIYSTYDDDENEIELTNS